jgi:predicted permease
MSFRIKFAALLRRRTLEAEMQEEMRAHVDLQTQMNLAAGMSPDDARHAALRRFGNTALVQEQCREQRRWLWLEQAMQDLGYAFRQLAKSPGFAATVIVTLGLGIGACAIVFTAINATLLHPLAGQRTNREVIFHETQPPQRPQMALSAGSYLDLEKVTTSFDILGAWTGASVLIEGGAEPVQVRGARLTPGVMQGWDNMTHLGREFLPEEFKGGQNVVMISHSLWQRLFGGDPDVLNRALTVNETACTIVGVISPRFARYGSDIEIWMPMDLSGMQAPNRSNRFLQTTARLKPGVTLAQAQAELDVLAANLARQYPDTNKGVGFIVRDLGVYINRSLAPMLHLLLGVVGCVLLIACANVANLLLARAMTRQREIWVRAALGASRGRIMRQLLVESLLLAGFGGVLGVVLAHGGLRFVRIYGPAAGTDLARLAYVELDPAVLVFMVGFSLAVGVFFGLAPAWLGSRVDLHEAMKQGARGNSESGAHGRLRQLLMIGEISLALLLLTGSGLLTRSFIKRAQIDPGFEPRQVATASVSLSGRRYRETAQRRQMTDAVLERVRALPGVERAAVTHLSPHMNAGPLAFELAGKLVDGAPRAAIPYLVGADYFETMGIRLVRGRTFDARDGASGPPVFVVNETFARQYFGGEDPLGHIIALNLQGERVNGRASAEAPPGTSGEIVGVVADVMQGIPGAPAQPQMYLTWASFNTNGFLLMVRTRGDPTAFLATIKQQVFEVDRQQPVQWARPLEDVMGDSQARSQLMLMLLVTFGFIALVIAAVGIYSVMAYSVSQRTMEFGIRMALGASRGDILRQVLRGGMTTVALGLVAGFAAAVPGGRLLESLLHETEPNDPATLGAIMGLLALVAFVACWLPARRATRVDPMVALRTE